LKLESIDLELPPDFLLKLYSSLLYPELTQARLNKDYSHSANFPFGMLPS